MIHVLYIALIVWILSTAIVYFRRVNLELDEMDRRARRLEDELRQINHSAVDALHHRATGQRVFAQEPEPDETPDVPLTGSKRRFQQHEDVRLAAMRGDPAQENARAIASDWAATGLKPESALTPEDKAHLRLTK